MRWLTTSLRCRYLVSEAEALPAMIQLLPGEDAEYLLALGRFTQRFTIAETALDMANTIIFHRAEGGRNLSTEVPNTLDKKTTFFRKAHDTLAALEPLSDAGRTIADRYLALKEPRHFLIHGVSTDSDGDAAITKIKVIKSIPTEQITKIPLTKLIALGDEAWLLAQDTNLHAQRLIQTLIR
jgi:hypothetical protein